MARQKTVRVKWKFDDNKNVTGSYRNYQLNEDFVKMLCDQLQGAVGTTVTGYTKAVICCSGIRTAFYAHPASADTSGMIGHLFILKNKTIGKVLLKLTTHREYLVICRSMVNKKLLYNVHQNQLIGTPWKDSLSFRSSWVLISMYLLLQCQ